MSKAEGKNVPYNGKYKSKYIKLGLKIQYYRKLRGYTQEVLAELADVSASFLSHVEAPGIVKGISLENLFAIADVLEIEPYQLLKED